MKITKRKKKLKRVRKGENFNSLIDIDKEEKDESITKRTVCLVI